jgi:probable HAF family extracellular repeat protein
MNLAKRTSSPGRADNTKCGSLFVVIAAAITLFTPLTIHAQLAAQEQKKAPTRYTIIDLGTLGGTFSQAFGINNKGSVVGLATLPGDTTAHAFMWRKGMITDLGTLAGTDTLPASGAYSINDNGEAVGFSETAEPDAQNTCGHSLVCLPAVWRDGAITALPTLGGTNGTASAINNRDQVVGTAQTDETDPTCQVPVDKPALWEKGEVRALSTDPFLNGIVGAGPGPAGNNDKGQVVGVVHPCDFSEVRALLWENRKVINMGTIEGLALQNTPAPIAINNRGQATGTYTTNAGINRAFVWQDRAFTDLGTLPGGVSAEGGGINDAGQIVGQTCSTSSCTVFLWQDGVMTDLNAVVPADASLYPFVAAGINSLGEIVGLAFDKNTGACCHGFLAIPENSAVAESTAITEPGEVTRRPNIVMPEAIRRILERQPGNRYHSSVLGVGSAFSIWSSPGRNQQNSNR